MLDLVSLLVVNRSCEIMYSPDAYC